ncbi:MAG: hypothetical protein GX428_09430 [Candidatus Atribacteria bacterium]|nr:hypothetical protein [Candidatus Atribacteria bacterium]
MKITMNKKKLERIKIVLDIIEKKIKSEPKKETFEIPLVEFIKMSKINDRISLEQIFKEIKEKTNENLLINIYDPSYEYDDPVFRDDKVKINLPLAVSFHIEDADEFNKYKRLIERQIKTISDSFTLILNDNGELYIEGEKENKNYPMEMNALRHKIVRVLASRKEYVQTSDLADEFEISSDKIRRVIESTKRMIEKFLKINDGNKIIENKKGLGYRITKIKIREK